MNPYMHIYIHKWRRESSYGRRPTNKYRRNNGVRTSLMVATTTGQKFDKELNVYSFKISSHRLLINCRGTIVTLQ